uniref:Uncharacterized protein n=1 Tax=Anopheles dirus TaxID=7168 RepID=A0A182N2Y2_9DIPT
MPCDGTDGAVPHPGRGRAGDAADDAATDTDDNMLGDGDGCGRHRAAGSFLPMARGPYRWPADEEDEPDEDGKSAGSGSDEDDSLLVAYDSNSVASV